MPSTAPLIRFSKFNLSTDSQRPFLKIATPVDKVAVTSYSLAWVWDDRPKSVFCTSILPESSMEISPLTILGRQGKRNFTRTSRTPVSRITSVLAHPCFVGSSGRKDLNPWDRRDADRSLTKSSNEGTRPRQDLVGVNSAPSRAWYFPEPNSHMPWRQANGGIYGR